MLYDTEYQIARPFIVLFGVLVTAAPGKSPTNQCFVLLVLEGSLSLMIKVNKGKKLPP